MTLPRFTPREMSVLKEVAEGNNSRQTAANLGISYGYVKNVVGRLYDKTGMGNRVELALWYLAHEKELAGK